MFGELEVEMAGCHGTGGKNEFDTLQKASGFLEEE